MKTKCRMLSMILAMVLVFTMIPLFEIQKDIEYYASTSQEKKVSGEIKTDAEMIELALEYFPEYSERIENPVRANSRTVQLALENDALVINETKNVSDDEQIVYQEYASGRANILFIVDEYVDSTSNGSNYTSKVISVRVYSTFFAGSMYIDGIEYTIYNNSYDKINDYGYTGMSALPITVSHKQATENASGPATATYTATFGFNSGSFFEGQVMNCSLVIEVGGNECTLTAY